MPKLALEKFGGILKALRIKNNMSLRDVAKQTQYDPSNWSKIERGRLAPPSDPGVLKGWAKILGLKTKRAVQDFVHNAQILQGEIPEDILKSKKMTDLLPAFFRTLGNKKPTEEDINQLIALIKKAW